MIASGYQILLKQKAKLRTSLENIWPEIFPSNSPKPMTIIEISGDFGTGKSTLLQHLIMRTVLPTEYGGKASKVIFLDLNHKFRIAHFTQLLRNALAAFALRDKEIQKQLLDNCLKAVIYLPCYSAEQFDIVLEDMQDLLWDHETVSLLAIDGLDAFYWEDCHERLVRMSTHYKKLCERLKPICVEHNICCIFTVDAHYLENKFKGSINTFNPLLDYKLKLGMDDNGHTYLNCKPFRFP